MSEKENESKKITEQQYLELAEQSKEIYERQDKIIKLLKTHMLELKKEIVSCYAYIRLLDELIEEIVDPSVPNPITPLLETLRSRYSQLTENIIMSCPLHKGEDYAVLVLEDIESEE